jgi:hypothetical protein
MKYLKLLFLLTIVLYSCEKKQTFTQDYSIIQEEINKERYNNAIENIKEEDYIKEYNILENMQGQISYDNLVGNWYHEWNYPLDLYDNTKSINNINIREVITYNLGFGVYWFSYGGEFSAAPNLYDGGSGYVGYWYNEGNTLIINYSVYSESGEESADPIIYEILLQEENSLILKNENIIEKWVKVKLNVMGTMLYENNEKIINAFENNYNQLFAYGETAIMLAISWRIYSFNDEYLELINYLIDKSDNINNKDIFGKNAAHYIIEKYESLKSNEKSILIEILKNLIKKGIIVNEYDIYGKTPFDYFKSDNRKLEILKELE